MKVMVIDDEESMRHMLTVMLDREGYDVVSFPDAGKALEALKADGVDFVLCDIKMPGMDGLEFLRSLGGESSGQSVIMMSAYGTIDTAVECMKLGAYDYVSKPFKTDEVVLTLKKAEERERLKRENTRLQREVKSEYDFDKIYTRDPAMLEILELVKKVSGYDTSVLVTGESGTGKELIARAIHFSGPRSRHPFITVNCGAIPGALLESELFGHVKGAFTDAHKTRAGLFQEAHRGTIFLDEVGELPIELQVKLLRVLQEGEVRKVGDTRAEKIDTRVVAATVKDLKEEVRRGRFREDLYYRLNVIEVKLPPLRDRPADIKGLAEHFVAKYSKKFGKPVKGISAEAMEALKAYPWPGNVRELENAIERAMILEENERITRGSLPVGGREPSESDHPDLSIKKAQERMERDFIVRALKRTGNNRTRAAALLEISHRALLYKIKSYGLAEELKKT